MKLYHSLVALAICLSPAIAKPAPPTPPTCSPGPVPGTRCSVECNTDRPQGDYRSFQASSFQACVDACNSEAICVSAQFQRGSYFCYLKSRLTAPRVDAGVDGVVCSIVSSTTATTSRSSSPVLTSSQISTSVTSSSLYSSTTSVLVTTSTSVVVSSTTTVGSSTSSISSLSTTSSSATPSTISSSTASSSIASTTTTSATTSSTNLSSTTQSCAASGATVTIEITLPAVTVTVPTTVTSVIPAPTPPCYPAGLAPNFRIKGTGTGIEIIDSKYASLRPASGGDVITFVEVGEVFTLDSACHLVHVATGLVSNYIPRAQRANIYFNPRADIEADTVNYEYVTCRVGSRGNVLTCQGMNMVANTLIQQSNMLEILRPGDVYQFGTTYPTTLIQLTIEPV